MIRPRHAVLLMAAFLIVATPRPALPWGSQAHHYIAEHYSQDLPAIIDGLRAWDPVVDAHVTDPDTRKNSTPGEAPRHFIDIDAYPEFALGTLTHDRTTLEAEYTPYVVTQNGILPWAIGEVVDRLRGQMAAAQWDAAALTIADLCHYAGDATQPLHCTQNYDGQMTGNNGVHARYETTMIDAHLGELSTTPLAAVGVTSPVDTMFDVITTSNQNVGSILDADNYARSQANGINATYYDVLWNDIGIMTARRIDAGAHLTAALVYTAWLDAGRPHVPGSSGDTTHVATNASFALGPTPFQDALTIRWSGSGPTDVAVYDLSGARVATLVRGASGPGSVTWRPAAAVRPGTYFVRSTSPGGDATKRVMFVP